MNKISFTSGLCLAGLSAAAQVQAPDSIPAQLMSESRYPRFDFAPHVMKMTDWSELTHKICDRAANRSLNKNYDFNTVLEANDPDWKDPEFSGWDRIFWEDYRPGGHDNDESERKSDSTWKRIKDVYKGGSHSLWGHNGIQFNDPNQGYIGDCWLIAAASIAAKDENRIRKIFHIEDLNSAGVYAVDLFIMGIPVTVTVDDYLPFWTGTDSLVYARPGPDESLWMPILEKAAAKLFGNYEILVGGFMGPAIQMLTGAPYFETPNADKSVDELWDYIDKKVQAGWMVTTASYTGTGSD